MCFISGPGNGWNKKNLTSTEIAFNPLRSNVSIYVLLSVLCIFPLVMTRRICLTIWSLLDWWSSPLFSWPFIWSKSNTVRRIYKPVTFRAQKITSTGIIKVWKRYRVGSLPLTCQHFPTSYLPQQDILN